jgi:hypothetical protein
VRGEDAAMEEDGTSRWRGGSGALAGPDADLGRRRLGMRWSNLGPP